ncbi:MAG TPA: hypothetical protein VKZ18_17735, partial [Polyangia bacterium]|nr:hypothetical protein [Polyangia bacterium]
MVVSLGAAWLSAVGPAERRADAAAFTTRLDFATAPDCPDAAAFAAVVVARLGYDPFDRSAPDEVLVRLRRRGGTFDGRVEWRDAAGNWAGEQEFPSVAGDCPRLSRQVAFAVAVQIQMLAGAGPVPKASGALPSEPPAEAFAPPSTPPPAPPASPSTPTVPGVPAVATAALAPLRTTRAPLALAVGASTFVAAGLSSEPVPFGGVFGQLGRGHLALELAAVASVPTTTRRADGAGVSQQDLMLSAA